MNPALTRRAALRVGARIAIAAALAPMPAIAQPGPGAGPPRPAKPLVIGHRGAPAHRPEHTLASYARAIADGADFIAPDLVATKDGVLVARHENNLAETTDVAAHPEFAARHTTKPVDGQPRTGWFTEDFTLAELKTLRARERLGPHRPESAGFDCQFPIASLAEIIDLAAAESARRGRIVGLIPEIKHSTYFAAIGLPIEYRLLAALRQHPFLATAPVIVQSFEVANLRRLRRMLAGMANVRLMQLTANDETPIDRVLAGDARRWSERLTPAGLTEIASYADFIAPDARDLIPLEPDGRLGQPGPLIAAAHRSGLLVGAWTFRPENHFLAADFRDPTGDDTPNPAGSLAEIRRYLDAGIDALFTDDPAIGRRAVDRIV